MVDEWSPTLIEPGNLITQIQVKALIMIYILIRYEKSNNHIYQKELSVIEMFLYLLFECHKNRKSHNIGWKKAHHHKHHNLHVAGTDVTPPTDITTLKTSQTLCTSNATMCCNIFCRPFQLLLCCFISSKY